MELHDVLSPVPGSVKKPKRKGQGLGSGTGKTAGRGQKGQKSRSGGVKPPGFEGGQTKLVRRVPKRGFKNIFGKEYGTVNVGEINVFEDGSEVGPEELRNAGLIRRNREYVKILGEGEIDKALTVTAHAFSASAKEKIEAAGGRAEVI
ncbi:MAG: 50S ribosomal protein L15 [Firmicutes bacterium]|jgi:large subunit ribosomal protein L15|nr:50S ribosomal protein L15 [Candidatus Fermentithermobacillaceae bacterium]